jgi:hypothetical protein
MADWMLEIYADMLETTSPGHMEIPLWVCSGGTTIFGVAVSYRRFAEEVEETLKFNMLGDNGEVLHTETLSESGLARDFKPGEKTPEYIHLLEVVILGIPSTAVSWARIRLSEVGAWGLGSIPR